MVSVRAYGVMNDHTVLNSMVKKKREGEGDGWMDERCFRPLLCTVKAELGRGKPGLMR